MRGDPPRLRRGLILLVLLEQYPHQLARSILERHMEPAYHGQEVDREFFRDLAYLEDSGYIERSQSRFGGRSVESFKITPKGIDVAERSVEDPGVELA